MFKESLEMSPDYVPSQFHLALMYHKSGLLDEALQ